MPAQALDIADLRRAAKRRLPRGIFDYVDRGAEDENGLLRLRRAFDDILLRPRIMVDVSARDLSTALFGRRLELPLVVAPTAAAGLVHFQGEIALARAAAKAGIPFTIATGSITEMERIRAASDGELWFQLYMWQERSLSEDLLARARATGIDTLVLTVDTAAAPIRTYNVRNGYEVPIRASLRGALDIATHPRWVFGVLLRYLFAEGFPTYRHYPKSFRSKITRKATWDQVRFADNLVWADLQILRRKWTGRLIVKGVLRPDDARRAVDAGVDGLVVSSHGGRNLDSAVPPVSLLPAIADTVGGQAAILVDSGVRRGADVVKLLALGAQAVMVGRAPLYGTAADGEAGATRAFDILRQEMDAVLGLMGCGAIADLSRDFLAFDHPPTRTMS